EKHKIKTIPSLFVFFGESLRIFSDFPGDVYLRSSDTAVLLRRASLSNFSLFINLERATEAEILDKFGNRGTILRPGFIHGTRQVGSIKLPLSLIGAPLEMVLKLFPKEVTKLPLIGPLLIPPVNVKSVAGTAVKAAVDPEFASGIIDVYGILQHGH
ncbi:PREDICTED: uncharacterized protein At1g32220, chloroplastic-like, partial [Camelina sativa]|uniref:Uncharacterized protein At1g32220, chloroplastic-like n=1 Tax=Camelina sativa TaxID=90675 RepID=A0ABM0Y982_CAMSA